MSRFITPPEAIASADRLVRRAYLEELLGEARALHERADRLHAAAEELRKLGFEAYRESQAKLEYADRFRDPPEGRT